ncbi:uncharacterized protein LOC123298629 [Chrysoperla carnea]|uniref:uncharacterized protein LOC123298629 n=1 Tax=Chrysoperla carnea TaxID=189513 RepID=UPI001D067BD4|nr:uncharacterized protein LOC123298629 [Chrysoperla carnea]
MKFLCLSVLVCGVFLFVSADTVLNGTADTVVDDIKNKLDEMKDQFTNATGDFGKTVTDGISKLSGKKGIVAVIMDSIIQTITSIASQVTKFFTDPIYDGLNKFADGIVKQLNNTINDIRKIQKCGNESQNKTDFTAPLKAVEKCAVDAVDQASGLMGEAVSAIGQLGTSIGSDISDTVKCVGSMLDIVNCVGGFINGGLRGVRDVSNTIAVGTQVVTGMITLLPQGVGCMAGQFNEIVQNATQTGLDVNKCILN